MIEIIAVLAVVAVVSAVVIASSGNVAGQSQLASQVAMVKSHIHFAQMMAMKSNVSWGISFTSNSSYTLQTNNNTATVTFPYVGSATYTLPSGVTVTASSSPLVFDAWGSPGTSTVTVTVTSGTNNTIITINNITGAVS
jgi:type II secretory pathway pseudopilin PulG